jgi:cytoskeletal protein CcmA (bactofilin family)
MNLRGKGHSGELNGILDRGSHLRGELHFEQTFRVDGKLTGKVLSDGDLVIGERGEIEGEIEVGRAFVSGLVRGRIRTARRLEICAGGRVFADVETPALVIGEGALFEGNCAMERGAPAGEAVADEPRTVLPRLAAVKDR